MARFTLFAFAVITVFAPSLSYAADLAVTPTAFSIGVGETATVAVRVVSPSSAVNAVSGKLNFSSEVEVVSVIKDDSIINFWVEEPKVVGASLTFEGVVLNPGYQGAGGALFKVLIRGKKEGVARASFSTGAVYANDGEGTNILGALSPAAITIGSDAPVSRTNTAAAEPPMVASPAAQVVKREPPSLPPTAVRSSSHPEQGTWYTARTGVFSWELPKGADVTRASLNERKDTLPTKAYEGGISELTLPEISEGVSYLAVQHRVAGVWTPVVRYRVHVDATAPVITRFEEFPRERREEGRVRFAIAADDSVSGVARYTLEVTDLSSQEWRDDGSGTVELVLPPGAHRVTLVVTDRAGNVRKETREVVVLPLRRPVAITVPRSIELGDGGVITGTAEQGQILETLFYPVTVDVDPQSAASVVQAAASALIFEPKVARGADAVARVVTIVDDEGAFRAEVPKDLPAGRYDVWIIAKDGVGGQSNPAGPYRLIVVQPGFMALGGIAISLAALVLPLLIAVLGLLTLSGLITWRHIGWRKVVAREAQEVEDALDKSFNRLRGDVLKECDELANEAYTAMQKESVERMKEALTDSLRDTRGYLRKEVEDLLRGAR